MTCPCFVPRCQSSAKTCILPIRPLHETQIVAVETCRSHAAPLLLLLVHLGPGSSPPHSRLMETLISLSLCLRALFAVSCRSSRPTRYVSQGSFGQVARSLSLCPGLCVCVCVCVLYVCTYVYLSQIRARVVLDRSSARLGKGKMMTCIRYTACLP